MAAGLGFKTFTTGEVLTAADTNGYLMQGILVFASAAARDASITSPQEGQYAYLKDTNVTYYYDGAAWVVSGATGDITTVTAGTGLTGGGASGDVTLTFDIANYGGGQYSAGKNRIINGDFGVWQRGTSFTGIAQGTYFADRFYASWGAGGASNVYSQQTFTAGTAPVAGYEGTFFGRASATSATTSTTMGMSQAIENVRTYAGQAVTLSFWAKADSARTGTSYLSQNFGSGGSATVDQGSDFSLTTSWTRFTMTKTLGSMSGKTIGTGSKLIVEIDIKPSSAAGSPVLDIWGVQVEAGSTATPFQTATGTIQGELAACQRYYWTLGGTGAYQTVGNAFYWSTTQSNTFIPFPVTMRTVPSFTSAGTWEQNTPAVTKTLSSITLDTNGQNPSGAALYATVSAATANLSGQWRASNDLTARLNWSAEL